MSDDETRTAWRAAAERAATALEVANEARFDVQRLRHDLEEFTDNLPAQLRELGVPVLTKDEYDYLLQQISVALAQRLLERQRLGQSEAALQQRSFWDARWARWMAVATVGLFLLGLMTVIVELAYFIAFGVGRPAIR